MAGKLPNSTKRTKRRVVIDQALPIVLLLIALIGAPIMIFSREGLPRLRSVERELSTVQQENLQLKRQIAVLRARATTLRDDPAAIEQLARDELGLIRQTEVVFQFPERR